MAQIGKAFAEALTARSENATGGKEAADGELRPSSKNAWYWARGDTPGKSDSSSRSASAAVPRGVKLGIRPRRLR
jgi:hypothetical protein